MLPLPFSTKFTETFTQSKEVDVSSYDDIEEQDREQYENDEENIHGSRIQFADPGGKSALRAASKSNPRNLPCPNCGAENRLTPEDRALGYQCDSCADRAEGAGS